MQINNKFIKGARGASKIKNAVIMLLAGIAAIVLGVVLFFLKDENGNGIPIFVNLIVFGIAALLIVISVFMFIYAKRDIQRNKPLSEEEVRANLANEDAGTQVQDTKLFFHFGGKMNQSYIVENKEGKVVFDVKLTKFNPVGNDVFDFINHENGKTKTVKASKVLSANSGEDGLDFSQTSSFRIDGVNCWDYLRNHGIEIKSFFDTKTIARYEIWQLGKNIANIYQASIKDPWNEGNVNILRTGKGAYRLHINDAKLDDIVMVAFIVARVDFVE